MRRYMKSIALLAAVLGVVGCATSPRSASVPRPAGSNPVVGAKVVVKEFDTSEAEVFRASNIKSYGLDIAKMIAEGLRKGGVNALVSPKGAEGSGDLVVEGKVVLVDGGIAIVRELFGWIGMVSAAGKFRVIGTVRDSQGRLIGEFTRERRSGVGGDNDGVVQRCIEATGYDIATMMTTGEYSAVDK